MHFYLHPSRGRVHSGLKFRGGRDASLSAPFPCKTHQEQRLHQGAEENRARPRDGNSDCDQSASAASDLLLPGGTIKLTSAKCVSDLLCISNIVVFHQRGAALGCVLPYCPTRNQRTVASSLREYLVPGSLLRITSGSR